MLQPLSLYEVLVDEPVDHRIHPTTAPTHHATPSVNKTNNQAMTLFFTTFDHGVSAADWKSGTPCGARRAITASPNHAPSEGPEPYCTAANQRHSVAMVHEFRSAETRVEIAIHAKIPSAFMLSSLLAPPRGAATDHSP